MTVEEIANLIGGEVAGDATAEVTRIAAIERAGPKDLAFAEGNRAVEQAARSQAGCVLVPQGVAIAGRTVIAVKHPKLALIRAAAALLPSPSPEPGIHPTAVIAAGVELGSEVSIGPNVVINKGTIIGEFSAIGTGSFLGEDVLVGSGCVLHPRVTLYPGARLGNRVVVHSGAVIGSDGFGYVFAEGRYHKFPQLGGIIIEDDVEIGANSTLDRGSLGTTIIGEGAKIDNLVQIAHNVKIGRHSVIAAQTGISGSVEVGDYVVMGGQVGIGDHARIGERVIVGGQAGILNGKIVPKGKILWGTPARPLAEFKQMWRYLNELTRSRKR